MTHIPNFNKPGRFPAWKLPPKQTTQGKKAELIELVKQDYTMKEIAEILGVSTSTVSSRAQQFGISFGAAKRKY